MFNYLFIMSNAYDFIYILVPQYEDIWFCRRYIFRKSSNKSSQCFFKVFRFDEIIVKYFCFNKKLAFVFCLCLFIFIFNSQQITHLSISCYGNFTNNYILKIQILATFFFYFTGLINRNYYKCIPTIEFFVCLWIVIHNL